MPQVCPVVGTTNTVLPPSHPKFDLEKPGQVCPVTNATTDHHNTLSAHPPVPNAAQNALACPALKETLNDEQVKKMDEDICPVVGTATTVLPPKHPDMSQAKEGDFCPVTNATIEHHKGKVSVHPKVEGAGGVCPVVGLKA